jgi:hypothetical protein
VRTYTWIEVVGKDPFTQHEEPLQRATAIGGPFDLKVPRAGFADHPRTEFRFWRDRPAPAAPPALVIYYLGVPDTTPEVVRTADLDGSLSARIVRAREESSRRAP